MDVTGRNKEIERNEKYKIRNVTVKMILSIYTFTFYSQYKFGVLRKKISDSNDFEPSTRLFSHFFLQTFPELKKTIVVNVSFSILPSCPFVPLKCINYYWWGYNYVQCITSFKCWSLNFSFLQIASILDSRGCQYVLSYRIIWRIHVSDSL